MQVIKQPRLNHIFSSLSVARRGFDNLGSKVMHGDLYLWAWLNNAVHVIFRHWVICSGLVTGFVFVGLVASIMWRPNIHFSYAANEACAGELILLPRLHKPFNNNGYTVALGKTISISSLTILSRQTCIRPTEVPAENSTQIVHYSLFGNGLLRQSVKITAANYPKIETAPLNSRRISVKKDLIMALSSHDATFEYKFSTNNKEVICNKISTGIACPISQLKLKQAHSYHAKLIRVFNGQEVGNVFADKIFTGEPVEIIKTSPQNQSMNYQPVKQITVITNRELKSYDGVILTQAKNNNSEELAIDVKISGKKLVINPKSQLPWRSKFKLSIKSLQSTDQGELIKPYVLNFKTSGGPAVKSANIASYAVSAEHIFTVNFDQAISPKQRISAYVHLAGAGGEAKINLSISGNRLFIDPVNVLSRCTTYTLKLDKNIENPYGISGESAWSHKFRTKCAVVSTIGYSIGGRPIYAYSFGDGTSRVVYVGAMHGTEQSGMMTLGSWVNELEKNPERIPNHRSVIVIPNSNPDGVAKDQRTNSNGVDLNRNFPADDWQSGVYMPGPVYAPKGGGSEPLSEPESKALASYIQKLSPRLVLTYHSTAAVVIGNNSGDANSLARTYASKSGYGVALDSQADDIFSYKTTGEFEDWLHDKLGIPAVLVEMATSYSNEFERNLDALWYAATLP